MSVMCFPKQSWHYGDCELYSVFFYSFSFNGKAPKASTFDWIVNIFIAHLLVRIEWLELCTIYLWGHL